MTCPVCGAEILDTADRFCSQCGNKLPNDHSLPLPAPSTAGEAGPTAVPLAKTPPASQAKAVAGETPEPGEPAPTEEQVTADCPVCGSANRPDARFCMKCGQSLPAVSLPEPEPDTPPTPALDAEPEPIPVLALPDGPTAPEQAPETTPCPHCGAENRPGARFCLTCGRALAAVPRPAAPGPLERQVEAAAPASLPEEPITPLAEPLPAEEAAAQDAEPEALAPPTPAPAPPPLAVKTIVARRYNVLAMLPSLDEGANLYAVADLQRCWNCEQDVTDSSQTFCLECGADVTEPPPEHRLHLAEVLAPDSSEDLPEGTLVEGERLYVLVPREAEPAPTPFPQGVRLAAGQASDAGLVRDLDEDSVLALTLTGLHEGQARLTVGLYIVADGIGGHEGGEWASRLATQIIARELLSSIVHPLVTGDVELPLLEEAVLDHLRRAVTTANQQIFQVRTGRGSDMGTTATLALVLAGMAYIANVGDSRTYLWGVQGLEQVTTDHSLIASLIASGMAQPEEIYTHPQRSAIYRSLGDKPNVEVDLFTRPLAPGNVLVLCCDGLWEMIHNEGLEDLLLQGAPPQATCDEAVRRANLAGGEDNISVVMVRVESNGGYPTANPK